VDRCFFGELECPLNRIEKELLQGNTQAVKEMEAWNRDYYLDRPKNIISEIYKAFLCKKIFPNEQLLDKCLKLLMVLGIVTDGMIFKTKKTNKKYQNKKHSLQSTKTTTDIIYKQASLLITLMKRNYLKKSP